MRRVATLVASVAMAAPMLVATPASADEAQGADTPEVPWQEARQLAAPPMVLTWEAPPADEAEPIHGADRGTDGDGSSDAGSDSFDRPGTASARSAPAPALAAASTAPTPEFELDFDETVSEAQADVFRAAANIWADILVIREPVTVAVTYANLGSGVLGGARPMSAWYGHPSFPRKNTAYVVALANQHAGFDLDPGVPDVDVAIASDAPFYEGIDTAVPADQYSLLMLAIHELGHGLGHSTWATELGAQGSKNFSVTRYGVDEFGKSVAVPLSYDLFVTNASGRRIVDMSSTELRTALVESLRWNGMEAKRRTASTISLYAPPSWEEGSSVGHLNDLNQLMSPFIDTGEAIINVPPVTVGMMSDLGWPLPVSGRQAFGAAVTRDFLDRYATPTELRSVESRLISGTGRDTIVQSYAFSDEWIGALIDGYYQKTLGRLPDQAGQAYWISVIKSGATPAEVAAYFYASPEYFSRSGGTNQKWVGDLYLQILRRHSDTAGRNYWAGLADRGLAREVIAYDFYQSIESRRDRVKLLYRDLLGRNPDSAGHAYWADILKNGRDVDLAIFLASSEEYYNRALRRFP